MNTPNDKEVRTGENKIQFLKYAITYLDNRIHLIDTKASLLIAIQGIFLGLLTFIFKQIFPKDYTSSFKTVGYFVVGVAFFFFVLAIISLLMTIRPTRSLLSLRVGELPDKSLSQNHVMWPLEDDGFPETEDDYTTRIDKLDFENIERNYKRTHFVLLQLIRKKYEYYRCSMLLMKISILWSAVGLGIIVVLRAFNKFLNEGDMIMDFPTTVQVAANFCTILGVIFAVVVLIFTWMQVKQGTDRTKQNVEIARGQFWLELERMFATHDPVHINLRPGGDWWVDKDAPDETKQPKSHIEWAQLEDYMGLFEHCQSMLERGLIDWNMFKDLFGYRLYNIVANPYIVEAKLQGQERKSWDRFIKICTLEGIKV